MPLPSLLERHRTTLRELALALFAVLFVCLSVKLLTPSFMENDDVTIADYAMRGFAVRYMAIFLTGLMHLGYDWRPDLAKYFEHMPEWHSMCQPTLEGDALVVATEIGAAIAAVPPNNLGQFYGYNVPGETQAGAPLWRASWEGGFPHALWVNRAGRRFADESFYRDYLPKTREWSCCEVKVVTSRWAATSVLSLERKTGSKSSTTWPRTCIG